MSFNIYRTAVFNDQLNDVIMYINNTFSKKEAIDYLNYLIKEIEKLRDFPYIGTIPRYVSISKQGYRTLVVKQNIIFYKVDDAKNEVILHIIVSSKREYLNLI